MKTFANLYEAIDVASEFGITSTQIAEELGISRQSFNNKMKLNGTSFTTVQVEKINYYLENAFTALHNKLNQLLGLRGFTQVKEPTADKFVVDADAVEREWKAMKAKNSSTDSDDFDLLNDLPF